MPWCSARLSLPSSPWSQDEDLVIGRFGAGGCAGGDQSGEVLEKVIQLSFAFLHAFWSAKTFQVGLSGISDDAMCGEGVSTISFYFLLMIGAHFDDGKLGILLNGEDGEGDTSVIVQIALSGISDIGSGKVGEIYPRG